MFGDGPPYELPRGRVGQLGGGDVGLGPLVRGQTKCGSGPEGVLSRPRVTAVGHVGDADLLAPLLVGLPEDRHLGDAVHGGQDVLDLGGIHVDAPADDEIVAPAGQVEEAIGTEVAEVTHGAGRPAPGRRRGRRVFPIAEAGEVGHVAPDGAGLVGSGGSAAPFCVGIAAGGVDLLYVQSPALTGPADGAGVREPVLRCAHRELGLGGAVELPDAAGSDSFHDGALDRVGTRRSGVGQEAQRVERLVGTEVGALQQALEVGRDEERRRGAVAPQCVEGGVGPEAAEDGQRPARQERAGGEPDGDRVVHR